MEPLYVIYFLINLNDLILKSQLLMWSWSISLPIWNLIETITYITLGSFGKEMEYCAGGAIFVLFLQNVSFSILWWDLWRSILSCIGAFNYDCFFKIGFFDCNARLGAVIAYDITQLIRFIKCFHQIYQCHTALPQMSLFLVTDFFVFFPFFDICFKGKINTKSLNILGDFGVLQIRHVHVYPVAMAKFWDT